MAQQRTGQVPNRRNLDLPLIACSTCFRRKVVRRVSGVDHSRGQVFYCCPLHKKNSGCPFFYWEDDYEEHLITLARDGRLAALLANDGEQGTRVPKVEAASSGLKDLGLVPPRQEPVLKELGARDEMLLALKAVCFVCVCMLVVQVLIL